MQYHADPVYLHKPYSQMKPVVKWLFNRYAAWFIYLPLLNGSPRSFLEELKGLSDGSGFPFDVVFRGNMLSEFNMTATKFQRKILIKRLPNVNECTSFAAFGSQTQDGSLIVGRNTDYSGASLWDVTQVVFFYQPQEGYRYANVGSAGLIKCNSCLNEKGMVLGGHFMYSVDVNPAGAGFSALQHAIMRGAAGIDEAYQILSTHERAGAFAYLIASGQEKDAAVIEATTNSLGRRNALKEVIFETNFMTTPECHAVDFLQEVGIAKNPLSRFKRIEELIHQHAGKISVQSAAQFMGDHKDMASGDVRPTGNVIATLSNLTSVIFRPEDFTFWVADGLAPVCNNPFTGFNLLHELAGIEYQVQPPVLEPNEYVKTAAFEALRRYYPVYVKAILPPFDRKDLKEQVMGLVKQIPGDVMYRLLLAKLYLREGKAREALSHFNMLSDYALSPSEQAQLLLFQGMTYDLLGEHDNAVNSYRSILQKAKLPEADELKLINPIILADAAKYSQAGFSMKDLKTVEISLDMGSLYDR
jgi:hypothetical protein